MLQRCYSRHYGKSGPRPQDPHPINWRLHCRSGFCRKNQIGVSLLVQRKVTSLWILFGFSNVTFSIWVPTSYIRVCIKWLRIFNYLVWWSALEYQLKRRQKQGKLSYKKAFQVYYVMNSLQSKNTTKSTWTFELCLANTRTLKTLLTNENK